MIIGFGVFFFFQAEDGIRDHCVTGVQTCALPISIFWIWARMARALASSPVVVERPLEKKNLSGRRPRGVWTRSEEHTSELQSHSDLVCRLLLEKKKRDP